MRYILDGGELENRKVIERDRYVIEKVRQTILDRIIELSQWKPGDEPMAPLATLTGSNEVTYFVLAEFFPTLKAEFECTIEHCLE